MTAPSPTALDNVRSAAAAVLRRSADGSLRALRRVLFPRGRVPVAPDRILVHLVGNVGDIVVATPMLQALADLHPAAHRILLTSAGRGGNPGAAELLRDADVVHEIVEYDVDSMKSFGNVRELVRSLRRSPIDLVVLCPASLTGWRQNVRNLLFARLVRGGFAIGSSVPTIRLGMVSQVRVRGWFPHESQRYLALLDELGPLPVRRPVDVGDLSAGALAAVDRIAPHTRFVAVCPGGKQVLHRWPPERFQQVVAALAADSDLQFVAIGNRAERDLCDRVLAAVGGRGVNAAGLLDLRETFELLGRAALLLTNDTGPMHLAAARDVPVVAVFGGAMPPGRWYPLARRATVLRADAACPRCLGQPDSPHCVERITADTVERACRDALAAGPGDGGPPRCVVMPNADERRVFEPTRIGWAEVL